MFPVSPVNKLRKGAAGKDALRPFSWFHLFEFVSKGDYEARLPGFLNWRFTDSFGNLLIELKAPCEFGNSGDVRAGRQKHASLEGDAGTDDILDVRTCLTCLDVH